MTTHQPTHTESKCDLGWMDTDKQPTAAASCFTRYSPTALAMEVVAYTDIQPGEELSLSCK